MPQSTRVQGTKVIKTVGFLHARKHRRVFNPCQDNLRQDFRDEPVGREGRSYSHLGNMAPPGVIVDLMDG